MQVETQAPAAIIFTYCNGSYIYLHIPTRITKKCDLVSGSRFFAFINSGKLILEQEKMEDV